MPNGPTEYWVTERVFEVGDTFKRVGETWIVTSVGESDAKTGKHATITVRRVDEPSP
jgi:hypothetical protein